MRVVGPQAGAAAAVLPEQLMEMMQMQMQQLQQLPGVAPQSDEVAELRRQLAAAEEQLHGEAQVADIIAHISHYESYNVDATILVPILSSCTARCRWRSRRGRTRRRTQRGGTWPCRWGR